MYTRTMTWAAVIAASAAPAFAQEGAAPAAERARQQHQRGVELFDLGQLEAALSAFEQSYQLVPRVSTLWNLAATLHALGRDAEAANALAVYLATPEARRDTLAEAAALLAALDSRLGVIELPPDPRDRRVLVDGVLARFVPPGGALRVAPGTRRLALDGRVATLAVDAGQRRGFPVPPPPAPTVVTPPARIEPDRRWAYAAIATGALAATTTTSAILADRSQARLDAIVAASPDHSYPQARAELARGERLAWVTNAGLVATGVSAAITGYLFVRRGRASSPVRAVGVDRGGDRVVATVELCW